MSANPCRPAEPHPCQVEKLPDWVPEGVRVYLSHTAGGLSLRAIVRKRGCHPSTVLRQVRRFENRRDDPLVDDALTRLDNAMRGPLPGPYRREPAMKPAKTGPVHTHLAATGADEDVMVVLRHLKTPGAVLVVAAQMPKAVVMLETSSGTTQRIAVLDRDIAEVMALHDWICCSRPGRVACYRITPTGEAALLAHGANDAHAPASDAGGVGRRARYGQAETPVSILARRREKSGKLFLHPDLAATAERLREDYVMAQLDNVPLQPVENLVEVLKGRKPPGPNIAAPGTRAARLRVLDVLRDLGPGLGDIALRCCCYLEGVESAETALGWSARSGKIVLRIALQRLKIRYEEMGKDTALMG